MSGDATTSPVDRLGALAERALGAHTADDVAQALLEAIEAAMEVDQVHLSRVSQDAAVARARVVELGRPGAQEEEYTQVFDDRPSGAGHVVATGEPLHVPDARASTEIRADLTERFDVGSLLFLPLRWRGEVHYVVVLGRHERRPFTPAEIEVAEALTRTASLGLALEEAERTRAAQRRRDAALARGARSLNEGATLQEVLEALAREADEALGGDMAGFYLGDRERGGVATAGHNTPPGWQGMLMEPGTGVAGQVLLSGEAVITNAYQSDVRVPEAPGLRDLQTAVSVPVLSGGEVIGALSVGFVRMRRIADEDLRTLHAIADLGAVACRRGA